MAARKAASKTNGNGSHATKRPEIADGIAHLKALNAEMRKAIETLQKHAFRPTKTGMTGLTTLLQSWGNAARAIGEIALPMFREAGVEETLVIESEMERDLVALALTGLTRMDKEAAEFPPLVGLVLRRMAAVMTQEEADEGLFAKAEESEVDKAELGKRLQQRAGDEGQHAEDTHPLPRPRHLRGAALTHDKEFEGMRGNERERDDHGRFMSDDDDRQGRTQPRRMSGRGGGSSSRYEDDGDHRGWHGDSRGHSEASRRGWDERRSHSRSGGRHDDDDHERSASGGRSSSREDYDDDRRGGGRRNSGWYGDSEEHAEASRRGWDNPNHGPSGWYGDREGHSRASQRGWDNPDHGRSGWYGDPEGHAEASRRGWDERRSSPSRRNDDDDDVYDRRRSMRRR